MACRVKEEMISQLPCTTAISPEDHKHRACFAYRVAQLTADGEGLLARVWKSCQGRMVCISGNQNWSRCRRAHLQGLIMLQSTREVLLIQSAFVIDDIVNAIRARSPHCQCNRGLYRSLIRQRSLGVMA